MFDHFVGLQLKALTLSFLKRIAEFMLLDRFRERRKKDSRIHAFRSIQRERERDRDRDRERQTQRETERQNSAIAADLYLVFILNAKNIWLLQCLNFTISIPEKRKCSILYLKFSLIS